MIKNAPKRIYLQVGEDLPKNEDVNFKDLSEVTWCEDKINDSDICYIRAGKCYTPDVSVALAISALQKIANPIKYLQDEAEKEGAKLDGYIAIQLTKSANFYVEIAYKALQEIANGR